MPFTGFGLKIRIDNQSISARFSHCYGVNTVPVKKWFYYDRIHIPGF
jgi:hypothetical protein